MIQVQQQQITMKEYQQQQSDVVQQQQRATVQQQLLVHTAQDPTRCAQIMQQLALLLHARHCAFGAPLNDIAGAPSAKPAPEPCRLPLCAYYKDYWRHLRDCRAGFSCTRERCASSRRLLVHHERCRPACHVCSVVRSTPGFILQHDSPTPQLFDPNQAPFDPTHAPASSVCAHPISVNLGIDFGSCMEVDCDDRDSLSPDSGISGSDSGKSSPSFVDSGSPDDAGDPAGTRTITREPALGFEREQEAMEVTLGNTPTSRKVWDVRELRNALWPTLQQFYLLDESREFRVPVNSRLVKDYYDVVRRPMDLDEIRRRLLAGVYADPWEYVEDVNLVFSNAWLYNKPHDAPYKNCTKIAGAFDVAITPVMRALGYCCGQKLYFSAFPLECSCGAPLCSIRVNKNYFSYDDRISFSSKCFNRVTGSEVQFIDDVTRQPVRVRKALFHKTQNCTGRHPEPMTQCARCGRRQHDICELNFVRHSPQPFLCAACRRGLDLSPPPRTHNARRLPRTRLGDHLEQRLVSFLRRQGASCAGRVAVRVLSSLRKAVEVKPLTRARCCSVAGDKHKMADRFPYVAKSIFAFEEIDGVDVCFLGMEVQEYGADCPPPNQGCVYLAYLDSVHVFEPRELRTAAYKQIISGYLDYCRTLGYWVARIWSCPPASGDDYIFNIHPAAQRMPHAARLQVWYTDLLQQAQRDGIVDSFRMLQQGGISKSASSLSDIPYLDGDFWPNLVEEAMVERSKVEHSARLERREVEATAARASVVAGRKGIRKGPDPEKKKKQKLVVKSYKGELTDNDIIRAALTAMKHQGLQGFTVWLTAPPSIPSTPPSLLDPDPLIPGPLMEGRDAFLAMARANHYEFSSLRRAKHSSVALLHALHTQYRALLAVCTACGEYCATPGHCYVCSVDRQ